jgi:predicted ATPase
MEYYIKRVLITGLFEKNNNYKIDFSEGCNCIYGGNGTGKTTIINLIVNSLNVELESLARTPFDTLSILLAKTGQVRPRKFFTLTRTVNFNTSSVDNFHLKYEIEGEEVKSFDIQSRIYSDRIEEIYGDASDKLKQILQDKVKLTHVPLLRMHDSELFGVRDERDEFFLASLRHRKVSQKQITEIIDPSVRVLNSLQRQFIGEANEARKKITEKLEGLKSTIIEKVMIDENFVKQVSKAFSKVSKAIKSEVEDINVTAYVSKLREAKINVPENKIYEHFEIWKKLNDNVKKDFEYMDSLDKDDSISEKKKFDASQKFNASYFSLFAMTHFHDRFMSIVNDVESMQSEKLDLTKSFREYQEEVNYYFYDRKKFVLNEDGRFQVFSGNRPIQLSELSSGEKHILTILGRAALSSNEGAVFVADEPELSLHLDWQRMILPSIMKLSPKSQIIVATHSPAIHAKGATEIDLEECL